MAYAKKNFEDDFVVVYEFGETRTAGPLGDFVVSKADISEWHVFSGSARRLEAEVTYVKVVTLLTAQDAWPPGVTYNA
jgi:hypothetical protein